MNSKHAVISDTHIVRIADGERKLIHQKLNEPATHISQLLTFGQQLGITHFWIMPGTAIDAMGYDFLAPAEGYDIFYPRTRQGEQTDEVRFARCWKKGADGTVLVGYPTHEPFGWTVKIPLDVLACVDYLTRAIGVDVQWSPQSMGEAYLKGLYTTTKRQQSYLRDSAIDLGTLPFRRAGQDILFVSPFKPEMVGMYFHLYDKNSAHPCAAQSMVTGIGEPIHITPSGGAIEYYPGIYRVRFSSKGSIFDDIRLPKVIASEWVTLDVLRYAMKQGYQMAVDEAYVFPQSHRLFDEWARELWQARQALKDEQAYPYAPGRENAYWTVKNIMNRTISTLRQNWWADMVGLSRVAKLANLAKLAEQGYYPQLVYYDDIGFLSSNPDAAAAVPGILSRKEQMGGYKHKFSVRLTAAAVEKCASLVKPGGVHTYLKKLANEELVNG